MALFVSPGETAVIREGTRYLRIEGAFYAGIGCLFLLYGLYRALCKPAMSLVPDRHLPGHILYYLRHKDQLMAWE